MGRHTTRYQDDLPTKKEVHPIWRGIGFILMIITPIISYAGTLVLLDLNQKNGWFAIPVELLVKGKDPLIFLKIGITILLIFLLYIFFLFLNYLFYSLFGPSKYGPTDAPPVKRRKKRR